MPAARLSPRLAPLRAGIAGPGRPATALALALVLAGCGGAHDGERRTFRLSGSVSGEHVSGVTVQLTGTQTATTTTDAAGAYAFEGLPAGHYTLTAPPAGGYAFSPASLEVDVSSDADGLNFTSTPVFSLSGTVSGAARSGIPIRLSGTRSATTLTDDAGNYAFTDLPAGEYAVTPIVAAPYTVAPAAIELILVGPDLNGQDFVVSETYSVSGTIAGPAVLAVRVNLLGAHGQPIASTTPDALGHYAFDGLAGGSYIIVPSLDGFVFSPERRMVTTGSTIPQDFAEIGACAIEGTVSGLDPANHSIVLSGPVTATVTTDATGHYAFTGLPPGVYTVTPSTMGGFAFDPRSRSVSATAGTASSQDFLSSGAFHVSGVITGARASGVTVNLSGRQTASATTDASGRYDFGNLPEGTYTVTPAPGSGYVSTPANASVNVSHNSTVGDFTVAGLYAISGKISGPVVEGVTVSLSGPGRQATTRTDSAGRYAFSDLGDGAYAVVPSVEGGYRFLPPRHDVQLAGASAAGQDFQEVGINTISGRVSGQIAAGVTVLLSGGATATTTTDAKGDYSFPDLPNGSYAVTPSSKDGYVFTPDQRPVSLTGWGASYQDFSAAGAYRITGTLTGLRTAYVSLALSGARTDTTSSGVGGQFTFASLANGTYTITPVLSDGYVSTPSSWTVQVNGADVARDFAVTGAYQIHGKVSGPAASGVTVTASGPASRTASPDAGGYALPGLPNGTYLLAISGPPGVAFTPTRAVVRVTGASLLQDFAGESYAVTEAAVPTADAAPFSIALGADGNFWFTEWAASRIGRITPAGAIDEFPLSDSTGPYRIVAGPDGALWFTQTGSASIGRISTRGDVLQHPIPSGSAGNHIAIGPDGNVWFTEASANRFGRVDPTTGLVTEFALPSDSSRPIGIAAGADGNVWMTDRTANAVLRCTTAGDCTPIHFPRPGAQLGAITAGPDGAVWVVEDWQASGLGFIARIATGSFTEFRVPTGTDCGLVSAGGALWFNQREANRIARMTTAGVLTEYALPSDGSYPVGIALGPDGRIWFAEYGGGRIGHL